MMLRYFLNPNFLAININTNLKSFFKMRRLKGQDNAVDLRISSFSSGRRLMRGG